MDELAFNDLPNVIYYFFKAHKHSHMFLKNGPTRPLFRFYFQSFQTNKTIFTTNICENVHPVYGARIRTHNLWNVSLFP